MTLHILDPQEVGALYFDRGLTCLEISKLKFCSVYTVRRALKRFGRPGRRGGTLRLNPEEIRSLYFDSNLSCREIASLKKCNPTSVRKVLNRMGLELRPKGGKYKVLNKVILIGRLTRDPEMRYTQAGIPVASFAIAVDRPYNGQGGERETDFIDIVAWRKLAETAANHLGKGRLVSVEGRLQVRSYEATDGSKRRAWEVVADNIHFLDRPKEGQQAGQAQAPAPGGSSVPGYENLDLDDDVPF